MTLRDCKDVYHSFYFLLPAHLRAALFCVVLIIIFYRYIIGSDLAVPFNILLEKILRRISEPCSIVGIGYVAKQAGKTFEAKYVVLFLFVYRNVAYLCTFVSSCQ